MLILKGNFIKDRVVAALPAAMLALSAGLAGLAGPSAAAPIGVAARAEARAPEVVAAEFYGWYLQTLAADQDPLSDRYERFGTYVARPLVEQLLQRLQAPRPGMPPGGAPAVPAPAARMPSHAAPDHGDYFLQSDRIEGVWLRSRVRAITVRQQARAAHVLVTLDTDGNDGDGAKHDLLLTMVLEGGAWKIRHVDRAFPDASGSSPDRPII